MLSQPISVWQSSASANGNFLQIRLQHFVVQRDMQHEELLVMCSNKRAACFLL